MPTLTRVFRRLGRHAWPHVPPAGGGGGGGYDTVLTFASSTSDSGGGVSAVAGSTDAEQQFAFNEITPRVGMPRDLEISEGGVLMLVVTFPSDYDGQAYTYTDVNGNANVGTFPSGNGTVNY